MKNRHHFVPQFYLRLFASSPKRINLLNLPKKLSIKDASIRDQCYKHKFYGKTDEIEDAFMMIENEAARVINSILEKEKLPPPGSKDYFTLLGFISFQILRTSTKVKQLNEMTNKTIEKAFEGRENLQERNERLKRFDVSKDDQVLLVLSNSRYAIPAIDDLRAILLYAGHEAQFITSDNPVKLYNQYCEAVEKIGTTGLLSKGIQVFFPLSPKYLLVLFDDGIYSSPQINATVLLPTKVDVTVLNILQIINSGENIYFSDWNQADVIKSIISKAIKFKKKKKLITDKLEVSGSLIHTYEKEPNLHLELSFLKIKRSARKVPTRKRANQYRKSLPEPIGGYKEGESKPFTTSEVVGDLVIRVRPPDS